MEPLRSARASRLARALGAATVLSGIGEIALVGVGEGASALVISDGILRAVLGVAMLCTARHLRAVWWIGAFAVLVGFANILGQTLSGRMLPVMVWGGLLWVLIGLTLCQAGFALRRLLAGLVTMLVIATLCFAISRAAPGSPFSSERTMHPEIIANFERFYGLDKSPPEQYVRQMLGYLRLDLGPSMYYRDQSCNDIVWPGFRTSLVLGVLSGVVAFLLGVPLGLISAAGQNRAPDYAASSISVAGICVPNFLLGPLLVLLFTSTLGWLPSARWPEAWSLRELSKLIMPATTLALVHVAYIARLGRAGMLDVMGRDYIRTARAKGLGEAAVFLKHGLKNGITPVISYAGPMWAVVITGSIVVESIFALPGLGQHFVKSALNRDMNLIMACVLTYSAIVIFFNFLVDVAYGWLDPRVRVQ